jgi:hypothetical protein
MNTHLSLLVVQRIEFQVANLKVAGSNPAGEATLPAEYKCWLELKLMHV